MLTFALAAVLTGCAASPTDSGVSTESGSAPSFTGVAVSDVRSMYARPDEKDPSCDDLANVEVTGKKVKIVDADGTTVGLSSLVDEGAKGLEFDGNKLTMGFETLTAGTCNWSFTVDGFDSQAEFFTISVEGVNGSIDVTRDELLAGPALSIPHGTR